MEEDLNESIEEFEGRDGLPVGHLEEANGGVENVIRQRALVLVEGLKGGAVEAVDVEVRHEGIGWEEFEIGLALEGSWNSDEET